MVTEKDFDLKRPELAKPIAELNKMVAALNISPPVQYEGSDDVYGENVFGIRFNGESSLALGVDAVSNAFWPTDSEAISPETASYRDYLLVCANYPDLGRTDALQYFATFKPGTSPWIDDEDPQSELVEIANNSVNIDSSAKLRDTKCVQLPPKYKGPETAYPMNLFWLTQIMDYKMAIIEINRAMRSSLGRSGLELKEIPGADARVIDSTPYNRFIIDPSSERNRALVDFTRMFPPNTFHLNEKGLVVPDDNQIDLKQVVT